jgi:hypothetical protein
MRLVRHRSGYPEQSLFGRPGDHTPGYNYGGSVHQLLCRARVTIAHLLCRQPHAHP